MVMGGIIGIDLIIIIIFLVMEAVVVAAGVVIIIVAMLVIVKITTAKHLILNLFQAQIDLLIQLLLKSQENEKFNIARVSGANTKTTPEKTLGWSRKR
jgi:hypothetical protein